MKSQFAALAALSTSRRLTPGDPYAILSCTVPANRIGSWNTTPMRSLQDSGVKSRMSARISYALPSGVVELTCAIERYAARVGIVEPAHELLYGRLSTST